jgi:mercuric ion binding protein
MMKRNLILGAVIAVFATWGLLTEHTLGTSRAANGHVSQTFTVENMTCAACPITVRKAMSRVEGVQSVAVNFEKKTVTAVYDPKIADAAAIAEASSSVGFPAQPVNAPIQ